MNGSRITAVGHYQPAKVLTNEDLAGMVDTSDEWIRSRVGIRTRRIAGPDEPVDELAAHAAAKALATAGITPGDIDLILVATSTAIDRSPNMAARVAARLGIPSPAAMDINVVCAGFTHALATADHTVRAGRRPARSSSAPTRCPTWPTGPTAPPACSSATVRGPPSWRRRHRGRSPGSVPCCGVRTRDGERGADRGAARAVRAGGTERLPVGHHPAAPIARQACERAGLVPADLAAVVLHQANLRIIEPLAEKIGAVNAVVARDVTESGNTSAASIPLAFSKLVEQGTISAGDPVLLFGFGGNLSYAGQVVRCP